MIIKCTFKELEDLNLLKPVFLLKGWTPDFIKKNNSFSNLAFIVLIDYVFEVEVEKSKYTDAIPYYLESNSVELSEKEIKELGLAIKIYFENFLSK